MAMQIMSAWVCLILLERMMWQLIKLMGSASRAGQDGIGCNACRNGNTSNF
jgi:hypothetical protein